MANRSTSGMSAAVQIAVATTADLWWLPLQHQPWTAENTMYYDMSKPAVNRTDRLIKSSVAVADPGVQASFRWHPMKPCGES